MIWHYWPKPEILIQQLIRGTGSTTIIIVADHWYPHTTDNQYSNYLNILYKSASYYQHQPVFCVPLTNGSRLLLIRPDVYPAWHQSQSLILTESDILANKTLPINPVKPWLRQPASKRPQSVIVIGAGIAGASTAYALAQRNITVTVLEQNDIGMAASGHHQGLLYAKISAHDTIQSELLLAGYGYSQTLLMQTLPNHQGWKSCGILHLDYNMSEYQRNQALAHKIQNNNLYQYVNAKNATRLAGIPLTTGGLWWPHGIALNPRLWCLALLDHPLITVHTHSQVTQLNYAQHHWCVDYDTQEGKQQQHASHIVLCMGAHSDTLAPILHWPFQFIRGQTTTAYIDHHTMHPRCALSGSSYITPAWKNQLCFGASFHPNSRDNTLTYSDQRYNFEQLTQWLPEVAHSLPKTTALQGHAAIRCDTFDHLPVVGAIGDSEKMKHIYAKLALDKKYRINTPCPWLQEAFINTAHGSRGLTTAPLCAEAIACAITGSPSPLSARLQQALHPNRLVIRSITHHLT